MNLNELCGITFYRVRLQSSVSQDTFPFVSRMSMNKEQQTQYINRVDFFWVLPISCSPKSMRIARLLVFSPTVSQDLIFMYGSILFGFQSIPTTRPHSIYTIHVCKTPSLNTHACFVLSAKLENNTKKPHKMCFLSEKQLKVIRKN